MSVHVRLGIGIAIGAALLAGLASGCWTKAASHDSGRIVYEVDENFGSKQAGLFLVDADGDHRTRLIGETTSNARTMSPVWSPNGEEVAFVSLSRDDYSWRVHVIQADGKGERRVASTPVTGPLEWSPDGTALLAESCCETPGPEKIALVNVSQGQVRTLIEGRDPAWSPNGSRLVFVRDRSGQNRSVAAPSLYSVGPDGTGLRLLFDSRGEQGVRLGAPAWAPDGLSVLVPDSDDVMGGEVRVRQIPAGGGRGKVVARGKSPVYADFLAISPDGELAAFVTDAGIEIVVLASGERVAVVNAGGGVDYADYELAWSPDGRKLAFIASPEGDYSRLYVVEKDGSDRRMISKRGESVGSFDWRPAAAD